MLYPTTSNKAVLQLYFFQLRRRIGENIGDTFSPAKNRQINGKEEIDDFHFEAYSGIRVYYLTFL